MRYIRQNLQQKDGEDGLINAVGVFKSEQPIAGTGSPATQIMRGQDGKPIRVPVTMAQADPIKVGLGAGALGAGLYTEQECSTRFDPPEPKYPGYNKFYAQNPGQFMPYDDPNIDPIDYSNYPDKPYSGIKKGGIIGLQGGGEPKQLSPQELFNKVMMEGYIPTTDQKKKL